MTSLDFEEEHCVFRDWYSENYPDLRAAEKAYRNLIHLLLSDVENLPTPKVLSRLKNRDECPKWGKL